MKKGYDNIKDRSSTASYKSNGGFLKKMFGSSDVLPLWVADMDFEVAEPIKEAISQKNDFGIYGYEFKTDTQMNAIIDWYTKYHQWQIKQDNMKFVPSVLTGLSIVINKLTNEGDQIIIQPPVYGPFAEIISKSNRKVLKNPLKFEDGKYSIDFDDLREKAKDPKTKAILICNPHNPVGRVWTVEELEEIANIAKENNLMILSDDIHSDIVYDEYKYTPIASISDEIANRTITFLSPGKTFNVSGIGIAVVVSSNEIYSNAIDIFIEKYHMGAVLNALSMSVFEAGYAKGRPWFDETMIYIRQNYDYLESFIEEDLKNVKVIKPEGTYLVWLDFRDLNMEAKELQDYLVSEAKLGLNFGHWFGDEGAGFARVNLATSRERIEEALENLKAAVDKL